ncbi:peptidylprolyl isomerase [Saccharicrinis fermentans]|uniref:Peptidyl-prolyl cis-trans isomerase n=1 Tax=Saccharicrinis fermentans DSM 9555 = JCM 21142 TaxID=869213 RepID=W7XWZ3_9BACT|nr:peptidylprolyl isomerase [Saccharicrinis fermentans]GAF02930.1 putative bifunctional phosphatase/peptidyl-prolyl cis-trans isomerase [Saccharicrinis fermentans DSM 9555 = JCM 21142]
MRKILFFLLATFLVSVYGCSPKSGEAVVLMKTDFGDIKFKLYNETPAHRDNFLRLAKEGYFDGTLFHRVIKDFMIQGGDPDSKEAEAGAHLGEGGPGYTLPAEFAYPTIYHKKGALAAARQGDRMNPEKRSSGSQFYIVQGEVFGEDKLTKIENQTRERKKRDIFNGLLTSYNDSLNRLQQTGDETKMLALQNMIMAEVNRVYAQEPEFSIPEDVKEVYKTVGGTPHLDGNYTVFGEVIEQKNWMEKIGALFGKHYGFEVIDLIAEQETDARDRPLKDVHVKVEVIRE